MFIYFRAEKNLPDSEDDMLVHSSVITGVDEDEPKELYNNDVTQSKYFKFSTFMKF